MAAMHDMAVSEEVFNRTATAQELHILISGRTGVGKSSLVNSLFGREVAEESEALDPKTLEVTIHRVTLHGVTVVIYDTPDPLSTVAKEAIVANCQNVDLALYCTRMDDRFRQGDKDAVNALTEAFGKTFWDKALFVLTFANRLTPTYRVRDPVERKILFETRIQEWSDVLSMVLKSCGVAHELAQRVPVLPAGDDRGEGLSLPDRENWLTDLWIACYKRIDTNIQSALVELNQQMLKTLGVIPSNPLQGFTELLPAVDASVLTQESAVGSSKPVKKKADNTSATSELAYTPVDKLHGHFAMIVQFLASSVDPRSFAHKLYEAHLIPNNLFEDTYVMGIPRSHTIRPLLYAVLAKVQSNSTYYSKFISILREYPDLEDLVSLIES